MHVCVPNFILIVAFVWSAAKFTVTLIFSFSKYIFLNLETQGEVLYQLEKKCLNHHNPFSILHRVDIKKLPAFGHRVRTL